MMRILLASAMALSLGIGGLAAYGNIQANAQSVNAVKNTGVPMLRTLYITNKNFRRARLQVRVGNRQSPEENRQVYDDYLNRGTYFRVTTDDEDVFYRREGNPDQPNGTWTDWYHVPMLGSQTEFHREF